MKNQHKNIHSIAHGANKSKKKNSENCLYLLYIKIIAKSSKVVHFLYSIYMILRMDAFYILSDR